MTKTQNCPVLPRATELDSERVEEAPEEVPSELATTTTLREALGRRVQVAAPRRGRLQLGERPREVDWIDESERSVGTFDSGLLCLFWPVCCCNAIFPYAMAKAAPYIYVGKEASSGLGDRAIDMPTFGICAKHCNELTA